MIKIIKENLPKEIEGLSNSNRSNITKILTANGVDIYSDPYSIKTVESEDDEIFYDPNKIFIFIVKDTQRRTQVFVYKRGLVLFSSAKTVFPLADMASVNNITRDFDLDTLVMLNNKVRYYTISETEKTQLQNKRDARAKSLPPIETVRFDGSEASLSRKYNLKFDSGFSKDRSGYFYDLNKYDKAIKNMRFERTESYLEDAEKVLAKLYTLMKSHTEEYLRRYYNRLDYFIKSVRQGLLDYRGEENNIKLKKYYKDYTIEKLEQLVHYVYRLEFLYIGFKEKEESND